MNDCYFRLRVNKHAAPNGVGANWSTATFVSCAALLLISCTDLKESSATIDTEAAPAFSSNDGLFLPDETRRSLELKLVEVSAREFETVFSFDVRVFQNDGAISRASGMATEDQCQSLKTGQSVQLEGAGAQVFSGKVTGINDQLQKATGMTELLVDIRADAESAPVGAFLRANITLERGNGVMAIPKAALLGCSEGQFVYTVSGDRFVRTAVTVGRSDEDFVEVVDGLFDGDEVVLHPVMSLWMVELAAVKSGQACCVKPKKGG